MISSVIAKFTSSQQDRENVMHEIALHPALEMGQLIDGRNLPITIETASNQETEQITRWLMELEGVDFVDVVYVHFEAEDAQELIDRKSRNVGQRPKTEQS